MEEYSGGLSPAQTGEAQGYNSGEEENDVQSPTRTGALFFAGDGSSSGVTPPVNHNGSVSNQGIAGGSTGDMVRKPRGRPPGSKNKPKPPIVVTRDGNGAMRAVVLEISAGSDVVKVVSQYARRHHVGLCVLSGSGTVTNVKLHLPVAHASASTLVLNGNYQIVSFSATFLDSSALTSSFSVIEPYISISISGTQGQVFGGMVSGSLIAASTVVLVVGTFVNPSFHMLPLGVQENDEIHNAEPPDVVVVGSGTGTVVGSVSATDACMSVNVYSVQSPIHLNSQISPDARSWPSTSRNPPY